MSEVLCPKLCVCVGMAFLQMPYGVSFTRGVVQGREGVYVWGCVSEEGCGVLCLTAFMNVSGVCVFVCVGIV